MDWNRRRSTSVKVAQVERAGKSFRLRDAVILPRGEPWRWEEQAGDVTPAASHEEIGAALEAGHRFRGRKTACSLPPYLYQIHAFRLPPGRRDEREVMVAHELAGVGQIGGADCEFDFWDIEFPGTDKQPESPNVNVLSLASAWGDQVARDFARLKLNCQVLDGPVHPLARAVEMTVEKNSQMPIAALDWGYHCATIAIVLSGKPLYARQIPRCGYHRVVNAVMETMAFSREKAQHVLLEYGLPGPHGHGDSSHPVQQIIADAIAHDLGELVEEINRTLTYLRTQRSRWFPRQLVLFGGGAMIRNIEARVTELAAIRTKRWRAPEVEVDVAASGNDYPLPLLASAIALSALAWTKP